jgi:hypothetical protein
MGVFVGDLNTLLAGAVLGGSIASCYFNAIDPAAPPASAKLTASRQM